MQTFLARINYTLSASVLDNKRLGKQRVECLQIMQIIWRKKDWLTNPANKKGFRNHPAVRMWEECPNGLIIYADIICDEWLARGFQDSVKSKVLELAKLIPSYEPYRQYPDWYTQEFIRSHQSNLIRKDPDFYGPKFPGVPDNLPYIWPV